jgi:hypothetical protein
VPSGAALGDFTPVDKDFCQSCATASESFSAGLPWTEEFMMHFLDLETDLGRRHAILRLRDVWWLAPAVRWR